MATKSVSGLEIPLEPIDDTAFHEAKRLGSTNPPLANPDPRLVSRLHGQPTNKQLVFHGEDATSCSLVPAASVTQDPDDLDTTFQPSKYLSYKGVSQSFARSPRPENLRSYPAHSHHYGGRLLRTSICFESQRHSRQNSAAWWACLCLCARSLPSPAPVRQKSPDIL